MRATASSRVLPLFAFFLALGLAACTGVHWQKAGGGDAALAQDLAACRKQAQDRFGSASSFGIPASTDPRFGATGPSQADLRMQESQSAGLCMQGKGYRLVEDK